MTAQNGFPSTTTAAQGMFNGPSSAGMIVGQASPDPATRFALRAGIVSQDETVPMWGGIGVYANIAPISTTGPRGVLGQVLGRANSMSGANALVGFSVFDQGYNMVNNPASPVPTAGSGQSLNYYPLGCRARIAVACDPVLISLRAGLINQQVSWDFTTQMLIPYSGSYAQTTITNAVWASTGGGRVTFTVGSDLTASIGAGDDIEVSGVVNTGGASTSAFNGMWTVVSITSGTIVVASPASGSIGTYASGGIVVAGGGALPVTILEVSASGNMVPQSANGLYTYNYNGAAARIQLTGGTTA